MNLKDILKMRLVSKKFDEACYIGLNLLTFDLKSQADTCEYILENDFDSQTKKEHTILSKQELDININLREYLKRAS